MRNPAARSGLDELLRLRGTDPASVRVIALDVLDSGSIGTAVAEVLRATNGCLDAVVASAGIAVVGPFEDVPAETAELVLNTNFFGVTEVVRAALPGAPPHPRPNRRDLERQRLLRRPRPRGLHGIETRTRGLG